jgi:ADP-heptose:LPS heptosyltransferase
MRRLLIVRTDAIGDAILWNGAMPGLRCAFPHARIAIACREAVAPIYEPAPEIDEIIPIDIAAIARDPAVSDGPAARLSAWGADLLLHPTRSREKHTEGLIARVRAGRKVALRSDLANATAGERDRFDAGYDELIATPDHEACELDRHADVLRYFGATADVRPRVVLTEADRRAAADLLACVPDYAVLSPSARWPIKHYPAWAEAIAMAFDGVPHPPTLVAVGGQDASEPAGAIFARLAAAFPSLRVVDLTGGPHLRTTCALIAGARLCIGNDTFTAHAAAALGVPSVTVVGGGHFGRFLPYDPASVVATMPLDCDGCHWRCRYRRAHCIKDLPAGTVAHAIRVAVTPHTGRPRVLVPTDAVAFRNGPVGTLLPAWVRPGVDIMTSTRRVPLTITR